MKTGKPIAILFLCCCVLPAQQPGRTTSFEGASASVKKRLERSIAELERLRERIAAEKIPLSRELGRLEAELIQVRQEYRRTTRQLDTQVLNLNNLKTEIKTRREEITYLENLLGEYGRNLESRIHIAELQRYRDSLRKARLAAENTNLSRQEKFQAQTLLLFESIDRLYDLLGGTRFQGRAVDRSGLVTKGSFAMIGPAAIFRSADGNEVGTAEQRLGSLEPAVVPFAGEEDAQAAAGLAATGQGSFPLDPTLGNAHKIESTHESVLEHIQKGGPVMIPIFILAGLALLVALYKWISLSFLGKPTQGQVDALLEAVEDRDQESAVRQARDLKGPTGDMLTAGAQHLKEGRDLVEEVMYEAVLKTKLKVQRLLPFIAICAASAPLLGLLGTVTGIINTFKLITIFGSGDVKTLSGGISEALITTKFGLIVAIPSLLLHAYLSRKARGVVGFMERTAVTFLNHVTKTPFARGIGLGAGKEVAAATPDPDLVRNQVTEILRDMLGPLSAEKGLAGSQGSKAGVKGGSN